MTSQTATRTGQNTIAAPFHRRQRVLIPAGTPLRSTHPSRDGVYLSKRAQTVTVHHTSDGHVDLWDDRENGRGYVVLPQVTWAGAGGYWVDAKVTPEFCEANGIEMPPLPDLDPFQQGRLDVEPAYGEGYDNRDHAPTV